MSDRDDAQSVLDAVRMTCGTQARALEAMTEKELEDLADYAQVLSWRARAQLRAIGSQPKLIQP